MHFQHGKADAVERRLSCGELLKDFETPPRLLNHAANAANLSFDPVEPYDEALLLGGVKHVVLSLVRGPRFAGPLGHSKQRDERCTNQLVAALFTQRSRTTRLGRADLRTADGDERAPLTHGAPMNEHSFMPAVSTRRSRPPAAKADRGDKRDALLRAAIETFAARGYFNAQVADVARTAGVAAGTVYLYFRGKDDLLISIFEKTMKEAIAAGRESIATLADPLAQLRTIARLHLDRMSRDRDLAVVFQVELRQSTKFMERFSATYLRDYLGIIRDAIAKGQATGAFRRDVNPTLAAKLLFGMLDEMATNWILSKRRYSLASEAEAIVDLFVRGVGVGRA